MVRYEKNIGPVRSFYEVKGREWIPEDCRFYFETLAIEAYNQFIATENTSAAYEAAPICCQEIILQRALGNVVSIIQIKNGKYAVQKKMVKKILGIHYEINEYLCSHYWHHWKKMSCPLNLPDSFLHKTAEDAQETWGKHQKYLTDSAAYYAKPVEQIITIV